jgi:hypothetical protein
LEIIDKDAAQLYAQDFQSCYSRTPTINKKIINDMDAGITCTGVFLGRDRNLGNFFIIGI